MRSSRGKNAQGRKVTGIEPMPGEDKVRKTLLFLKRNLIRELLHF